MTENAPNPLVQVLAASHRHGYGVYLGESLGALRAPIFARPQDGVLVLGPPRSGKTACVVVPNVVAACGPVIAASTKPDVLASSWPARSLLGPVFVYDPSGKVPCPPGVQRVGWSPLAMARTWDGAVLVAESMVQAARPGANRGESSHWTERSSALLSVMLHAGALAERPLSDVLGAIDRHDPDETRAALARNGADRALDLLEGIVATDGREQSGIWSTTSGVLAGYRTDAALATAKCDLVDPIALLNSRSTLYICADSDYQRQAAPLVAGLVRQMRSAAYQASANATLQPFGQAQAREGVSPRPPLLLVLDELANIAPLHDLPTLIAEGGSQGVVTLACLQDLSQARARWGDQADGFLSLFGTKLVFPGIGDTRTLQAISVLAGETQVPTISITRGGRQGTLDRLRRPTSRTVSVRKDRVLPPDAIAQGRHGHVLGIEGARPGFMRTTPWYETSPWREATTLSREEVRERQSPTNRVEAASRSQLGTPQRSIGHR